MSKRKEKKLRRYGVCDKPKRCDPGMCTNCEYLGDGNAVCTRFNRVPVMQDWQSTPYTLICKGPKNESSNHSRTV